MRDITSIFKYWCDNAIEDNDLKKELDSIKDKPELIEDAFYRELEFGTGGLRGVIGAGTNRMNIYVIRKASQGLANYINNHYKNPSIAISYDSRIKSDLFARTAAEVFAANDIKVHIYKELMPTPNLSYAVRELHCSAGIMVTASHNPSKYNGYKVYGDDGCQITNVAANDILNEIEKIDPFKDVNTCQFSVALKNNFINYIDDSIFDSFIERVSKESLLFGEDIDKDVKIIYSPLNGTGLKPVTTILKMNGYRNVSVVKEQEKPDGNFPTCPYPNPEIKEALALGIKTAKKENADLFIATDPDCDRVGTAVKNEKTGEYELISGNQMGVLLLDYVCSQRVKHNKMPTTPIAIKTIVTTDMAFEIAKKYNVTVKEVLTGFKYIGEQILYLEKEHKDESYIFGFEESYGYLSGSYVRDKDAVDGSFLIAEMFAYYKTRGISLLEKLDELYKEFGYYSNYLNSFAFEGSSGFKKMQEIMEKFRANKINYGLEIKEVLDYKKGVGDLPKSNVIKIIFKNGGSVVARPSGTEPKLKIYFSLKGESLDANKKAYEYLLDIIKKEIE